MLDINVALVIFVIYVLGYVLGTLTGLYMERKYGKKNRSAFPNMAVKRRR